MMTKTKTMTNHQRNLLYHAFGQLSFRQYEVANDHVDSQVMLFEQTGFQAPHCSGGIRLRFYKKQRFSSIAIHRNILNLGVVAQTAYFLSIALLSLFEERLILHLQLYIHE